MTTIWTRVHELKTPILISQRAIASMKLHPSVAKLGKSKADMFYATSYFHIVYTTILAYIE